jgi:hypothetical protein
MDGRRIFRQSKTDAIVAIREAPQLAARLENAHARGAEVALRLGIDKENRAKAILIDETTGRGWNKYTYRHEFARVRALAAAGCPSLADKHDQDLRDTAVTWLARAGATLPQIAAITGHSLGSIHSIMKHYLAITPELGDVAIELLTAWMDREGIKVA